MTNNSRNEEALAHMSPAQRRAYGYGYRAGARGTSLEAVEGTWLVKPRGIQTAWLDGYTDGTAGFDYGDTPAERLAESAARVAATIARFHRA